MIDLAYWWLYYLWDLRHDGTVRNLSNRLLDNSQRLPHFPHAHDISIIGIAVLPNRNFEIKLRIRSIRLSLPKIPFHAAGPQHRAGHTQRDAFFGRNPANILGAFHPDPVGCKEFFVLVNLGSNEIQELLNLTFETFVGFIQASADAKRVCGQAGSAVLLKNLENFLPVAKSVEEWRDSADIEGVR